MNSDKVRKYGRAPYRTVLVHGGPGAAGEMAPVARMLASGRGVVEAFQTAVTVEGQVEELKAAILAHCEHPVVLVGHSWGAWLASIVAARYPAFVGKLVLVGSGPLMPGSGDLVEQARIDRLGKEGVAELKDLLSELDDISTDRHSTAVLRIGELFAGVDTFDPVESGADDIRFSQDIFQSVWPEAAEMRQDGRLLDCAAQIVCPLLAIHGDYDPHPYQDVSEPLSKVLGDFRFVLLEKCGHKPWIERHARERFYDILDSELP